MGSSGCSERREVDRALLSQAVEHLKLSVKLRYSASDQDSIVLPAFTAVGQVVCVREKQNREEETKGY